MKDLQFKYAQSIERYLNASNPEDMKAASEESKRLDKEISAMAHRNLIEKLITEKYHLTN